MSESLQILFWSLVSQLGNYLEKCPVRIWKRYISLQVIDLLISNNFSSMTFYEQLIFYELSVVVYTTVNQFFYWFFVIMIKKQEK